MTKPTTQELNSKLYENLTQLPTAESRFKEAVGGLSNVRRAAAFDYVRILRNRADLLEQVREAEAREYLAHIKEVRNDKA